jgi:hypothetical protein
MSPLAKKFGNELRTRRMGIEEIKLCKKGLSSDYKKAA